MENVSYGGIDLPSLMRWLNFEVLTVGRVGNEFWIDAKSYDILQLRATQPDLYKKMVESSLPENATWRDYDKVAVKLNYHCSRSRRQAQVVQPLHGFLCQILL